MPFNLQLPPGLRKARWKVKIRDKESREPPHVTVLRGARAWRIDLRTGEFMDRSPDPADIPEELVSLIKDEENWSLLCDEWDRKYPANPVDESGEENE